MALWEKASDISLHERISADISDITQSYCLNNFVTVRDNLKLQIRLDLVIKQVLNANTTITFKLSDIHFIGIFTILEH